MKKTVVSKKSTNYIGCYEVTVDGYRYLVYRSDGLWWSKDYFTRKVIDCNTTKAQVMRYLEEI